MIPYVHTGLNHDANHRNFEYLDLPYWNYPVPTFDILCSNIFTNLALEKEDGVMHDNGVSYHTIACVHVWFLLSLNVYNKRMPDIMYAFIYKGQHRYSNFP